MYIQLSEHKRIVDEYEQALIHADKLRLAMAMLLVQAAGGTITVPGTLSLSETATTWLQEHKDHETGDRVFTTYESTPGGVH